MTKRFIAASRLVIPENRQRREFKLGELNELAASIQTNGLIHAPTVRIEGEDYILVSGERRVRAIKDIYELGGTFSYDNEEVISGLIPYTFLGDLSPIEAMEVELEENVLVPTSPGQSALPPQRSLWNSGKSRLSPQAPRFHPRQI